MKRKNPKNLSEFTKLLKFCQPVSYAIQKVKRAALD